MIDIHCHILPCLDDGPVDIESSIEMARKAVQEGVTTVFATPHCIPETFNNEREVVLAGIEKLVKRLDKEGIPLTILPGMEVHLTLDAPQRLANGTALTVGDLRKYVLLEFPLSSVPSYAEQIIFNIMLKGIRPIIAHPERNKEISANPAILYRLIEKGCLVQVTSGSLTGLFGKRVQQLTRKMVQLGWVDFIASDAHDCLKRPVLLKEAFHSAVELIGQDKAERLVLGNPLRVLSGESICKGEVQPYLTKEGSKAGKGENGFWTGLTRIFKGRS